MIKTMAFLKCRHDLSHDALINQFETGPGALAAQSMPTAKRYMRRYLRPVADGFAEPDFNVITETWFEDQRSFEDAILACSKPNSWVRGGEDEQSLIDRSALRFALVEEHETDLPRAPAKPPSETKFLAFLKRKQGMRSADFLAYYESHHAPFAARYLDKATRYLRKFLHPIASPGTLNLAEPDFHVVTEVWFPSQQAMQDTHSITGAPDVAELFASDEENLFDRRYMKFSLVEEYETSV